MSQMLWILGYTVTRLNSLAHSQLAEGALPRKPLPQSVLAHTGRFTLLPQLLLGRPHLCS